MEVFLTKFGALSIVGTIGAVIAGFFGGWTMGMTTLVILMAIDYITGLMVAGIFKKSKKSESGGLESKIGWKGLCKKGVTLMIVLVSCRLDIYFGTNLIRDAVVVGYIANELLSIVENAGRMGVPIPKKLRDAIDVLKKEDDGNDEDSD